MSNPPGFSDIDSEMANLTVRDRLDWPYLLNYGYLTVWMSRRKENISDDETEKTVQDLESCIPEVYKDETFKSELAKYTKIGVRDIRPKCGGIRLSVETCKELGIPIEERVLVIGHAAHLQAITNMLQRIGVVAQKDKVEKFTGKHFLLDEEEEKENEQPTANVGVGLGMPDKP